MMRHGKAAVFTLHPLVLALVATPVLVTLLASCGGSSGSSDNSTGSSTNVSVVETTTVSNGCLTADNAEASVEYLIGDKQAKNLIWNCADYDIINDSRFVGFYAFDYADQCYKNVTTRTMEGVCGAVATAPSSPLLSARTTSFNVTRFTFYESTPGASWQWRVEYNLNTENTGNVDAFGLHYDVTIDGESVGTIYLDNNTATMLAIGETKSAPDTFFLFTPVSSSSLYPFSDGKVYTVTVTLRDYLGNALDSAVDSIAFESVLIFGY